jgi:hypothetical protein
MNNKTLVAVSAAAASVAGFIAYRRSQAAPKVTHALEGAADGVSAIAASAASTVSDVAEHTAIRVAHVAEKTAETAATLGSAADEAARLASEAADRTARVAVDAAAGVADAAEDVAHKTSNAADHAALRASENAYLAVETLEEAVVRQQAEADARADDDTGEIPAVRAGDDSPDSAPMPNPATLKRRRASDTAKASEAAAQQAS